MTSDVEIMYFSYPRCACFLSVASPCEDTAPLTVKLYINRQSMGFSDTDDMEPAQTLELTPDDLVSGSVSVLKFVKFQRVTGLSVRC